MGLRYRKVTVMDIIHSGMRHRLASEGPRATYQSPQTTQLVMMHRVVGKGKQNEMGATRIVGAATPGWPGLPGRRKQIRGKHDVDISAGYRQDVQVVSRLREA